MTIDKFSSWRKLGEKKYTFKNLKCILLNSTVWTEIHNLIYARFPYYLVYYGHLAQMKIRIFKSCLSPTGAWLLFLVCYYYFYPVCDLIIFRIKFHKWDHMTLFLLAQNYQRADLRLSYQNKIRGKRFREPSVFLSFIDRVLEMVKCKDGLSA